MIKPISELKYGKYGTVAQEIYDECCENFGWDKSLRNEFGNMQLLYAANADADKNYGVWFISKSNLNGYKANPKKDKWENNIEATTIKEEYFQGEKPKIDDINNRIIFARKKVGYDEECYYYLGIYFIKEQFINDKGNYVRIYELV